MLKADRKRHGLLRPMQAQHQHNNLVAAVILWIFFFIWKTF